MDYISTLDKLKDTVITLNIDKQIYSKVTILKTCYKFTDSMYIYITPHATDSSLYTIYFQQKEESSLIEDIIGKFNNELLDQELRAAVLSETQKVRDTIVTRALLSGQPHEN